MPTLYDSIRVAADCTREVIVGFSCGKDSIAALDLCAERFDRIEAYFMYLVPGLGFQERYLAYIERRYGITILRVPHFGLAQMLRGASYRPHGDLSSLGTHACPVLKPLDVWEYVRAHFGIDWIATGEKLIDSIERRASLPKNGVHIERRICYPVLDWTNKHVWSYVRQRKIQLPPDYRLFGRSFGRLFPKELIGIRDNFPDDYEKILARFPWAEAQVKRYEFGKARQGDDGRSGGKQVSEIRDGDDPPIGDPECSI